MTASLTIVPMPGNDRSETFCTITQEVFDDADDTLVLSNPIYRVHDNEPQG